MHHSNNKDVLEYVLSGLIGGLAIGLGIVIVRELIRTGSAAVTYRRRPWRPGPAERWPGGRRTFQERRGWVSAHSGWAGPPRRQRP